MEEGATRNFEAFRLAKKQEERLKQEKEEEELNNPMKVGKLISYGRWHKFLTHTLFLMEENKIHVEFKNFCLHI